MGRPAPKDAYWGELPARALPARRQAHCQPKDPHAAIYNAKLAALVDKVEKAQLQAVANEETFALLPVKPKRA